MILPSFLRWISSGNPLVQHVPQPHRRKLGNHIIIAHSINLDGLVSHLLIPTINLPQFSRELLWRLRDFQANIALDIAENL
jgi:hypothetical protein